MDKHPQHPLMRVHKAMTARDSHVSEPLNFISKAAVMMSSSAASRRGTMYLFTSSGMAYCSTASFTNGKARLSKAARIKVGSLEILFESKPYLPHQDIVTTVHRVHRDMHMTRSHGQSSTYARNDDSNPTQSSLARSPRSGAESRTHALSA